MESYELDLEQYAETARQAAAEGCVLLENKGKALPLRKGEHVALFGRSAFNYYKSGLGSGGLVNARYVVSILDALKEEELELDEELLRIYENWIEEHPYDRGQGWGKVPWAQEEMPVTEEMLEIARKADMSLIIIGRTAGEDQDNKNEKGSYLLSDLEEEMIARVTQNSRRTAVVLNVGNIIDMSWVEKYRPDAVLYVWQGGQEGGHGAADVLTGRVNACGKLTDTIARRITDYPSDANFGDETRNYYKEDIYVGYRYFETFDRDCVLYPFGYGLSYTEFAIDAKLGEISETDISLKAEVKNTGILPGKEVVEVYLEAPQGLLGSPARKLIGFAKTDVIQPGMSRTMDFVIPKKVFASYDDSGITGHKSCYVLEEGTYTVYAGSDVRSAQPAGSFEQEFSVLEQLEEAYAPTEKFRRLKPAAGDGGTYQESTEDVPVRSISPETKRSRRTVKEIPFTGDMGYRLTDVLDHKVSMEDFIGQISDDDLIAMFRGEGMCSTRVTPGTAAAFGGVTDGLEKLGIPAACCSDGPSGIRMDCGTKAFSIPNGTMLGCTFNEELNERLFRFMGKELRLNKIDSLLGPGMNIHRHPLNGRNFEYISEDPFLTGKIAAAQLRGMAEYGIAGTIKHFCANNQETARRASDSVISERALREIYLRGFEIAVKEGHARSVMTTYGAVNGIWTAGSYDLCTAILRDEWGFDGIVMTDWWAEANYEGSRSMRTVKAPMVMAQNDIYMCVSDPGSNPEGDDVREKLTAGEITRGELQRGAANILNFILRSPSILHKAGRIPKEELEVMNAKGDNDIALSDIVYYESDDAGCLEIDGSVFLPRSGNADVFGVVFKKPGVYSISMKLKSDLNPLAQLPVSVFFDNALKTMITIQGTEGKTTEETRELGVVFGNNHFIKLHYGADGLEIEKLTIRLEKELDLSAMLSE